MRILVCGGAGFIGSHFSRIRLLEHGDEVTVLDKLTYAGRRENLADLEGNPRFSFLQGAIEDPDAVARALDGQGAGQQVHATGEASAGGEARGAGALDGQVPGAGVGAIEAIVNFAAETHVDRSISEPDAFVRTHALGTNVLLEAAKERGLRYVQISTDEVYGSIAEGTFTEDSPLEPSSPYSASKAGADLLVLSYVSTHGLNASICRGSNNYGPYQYPEKLIPLMILNALHGDSLPIYGDGMQVRNWIHVTDFARAAGVVLERGQQGQVYNAGGPDECANIDVVRRIIELTGSSEALIEHVADRLGHDRRYSLSSDRVRALGWEPQVRFAEGLADAVSWYREQRAWWEPIRSGEYRDYYERQYGRALG